MEVYQFSTLIAETLAEHPSWLPAVLEGMTAGITKALGEANRRAADKDQAMLAALTLASNQRLGPDLLATLRNRVAQSITQDGASQIERDFLIDPRNPRSGV